MFKPTLAILAGILVCYQPAVFADSEMFRDLGEDPSVYSNRGYEYRDRFPREIEATRHIRNCGTCRRYGESNYDEDRNPGADYLNDHR